MPKLTNTALAAAVFSLLAGCAAMGVVATDDPAGKLRDATALFGGYARPLPAERLIREAIDIYEKQNDSLGLAEAYRTYGLFFRSTSIEGPWSKLYRERGFLDPSRSATVGGAWSRPSLVAGTSTIAQS
jgi:hypothetical protein